MQSTPSFKMFRQRIGRMASLLTAGGAWAAQLPDAMQHNLRWYWGDGVLSASQDAINVTYLSLFVLALGATNAQIGLMSSLASLGAVIMLLPGAYAAENARSRKWVVVASGGGVARIAMLALGLLPFFVQAGPTAVAIAIALKVLMDSAAYFGNPGWTSLSADIVPIAWRGRFYGNRNMVMGVANMLVTLLAGQIITGSGNPLHGYQIVYGLAVLFGASASFCFAHIQEPAPQRKALISDAEKGAEEAFHFAALLQILRSDRTFLMYIIAQVVWNFSLAVSGPFFTVYQIEVLKSNAFIIGVQGIITALASLPAQQLFGRLNDRWGARKVVLLTGFLIPLIPIWWCFVRTPWDPSILNVFSGFMWAGYNLANFNMLLSVTDPSRRARYTALFQISMMISASLGSALGSLIISQVGYIAIFVVSGVGRFIGGGLMLYLVKPKKEDQEPSPVEA